MQSPSMDISPKKKKKHASNITLTNHKILNSIKHIINYINLIKHANQAFFTHQTWNEHYFKHWTCQTDGHNNLNPYYA